MDTYWKIFNFLARRLLAVGFIVVGIIVAAFGVPSLLPGGTIDVDGVPSTDIVFRLAAVFLPLVIAALGVALFRVKPFYPSSK